MSQDKIVDEKSFAMTVTGKVPVASLGFALPHEHIIHRASIHSGKPDNTCVDRDLMVKELKIFRKAGGRTICDVTPIGLGRDTMALRDVSKRSGVQIISGVGLYQVETWPKNIRNFSQQQLADYLVCEAEGGDSGIRAGLIGEIASHNEDHAEWKRYVLREEETKVFRAVADVQRRTGLCISTHASLGRAGVAQLRTIVGAGGDPQRVIVGHCDACVHADITADMEYYHELLSLGAWLEFDLFGWDELAPDAARVERVAALVAEGFSERILLSSDTCRLSHLHNYNGRGFDFLIVTILPALHKTGVNEQQIHQMTVINPASVLSYRA